MEGAPDRECARLSRGHRGTDLGSLRAQAKYPACGTEERQGCQRRTARRARGAKTPSLRIARAPKWGARREARFPPGSFPEPQGFGSESDVRTGAERPPRERPLLGSDGARVLGTERFRVQKSVERIAGRDARGATKRTSDTRDLARRNRIPARQADCEENERRRCAGRGAPSNHGDADWLKPYAQASSGSHPEGCGLGDSRSPRAASGGYRYDGRVSEHGARLSKTEAMFLALAPKVIARERQFHGVRGAS